MARQAMVLIITIDKSYYHKLFCLLILLPFLYSCKSNLQTKTVLLPNQRTIQLTTIQAFNRDIPLDYHQYEGFKGELKGAYLNSFVLVFENPKVELMVEQSILTQAEIDQLYQEEIKAILFDKIPDEVISFPQLLDYLKATYKNTVAKNIQERADFIDQEVQLIDRNNGRVVCTIQYVKLGISGSFVRLE